VSKSIRIKQRRAPQATARHIAALVLIATCAAPCLTAAPDTPEPYKVGPEDVVNVAVARHPEFSGEFYVPPDGSVSLPAAGSIQMTGKTLSEIAGAVSVGLRSRLRSPEVTVTLRAARRQQVYVLGAVARPGLYDAKPEWPCSEALAAAGGLSPDVDPAECRMAIRPAAGGPSETVEIASVLRHDGAVSEPALRGGDTLMIDAPEVMSVYVAGKVKNPGLYRLRKDKATVLDALTMAGGELDNSALTRISITHGAGPTETYDLTAAIRSGSIDAAPRLRPMDVVLVPEDTGRVAVVGSVNEPGVFQLKGSDVTRLMDAIGQAKGPARRSNIGSVAIVRTQNGRQQPMVYNLGKFLKSGDITQNPVLKPGDVIYVPGSRSPDWSSILGSMATAALVVNPFLR